MMQDTGQPVFLPFRMSCFVISNLIVTAGMLTPGLKVSRTSSVLSVTVEQDLTYRASNRQQALFSGK